MKNNIQRDKLVEIKKGQTGTGILIESDGYVSRDLSENNKKIIKEAFDNIQNGEWNVPNPFVLDVVLQKFGIQNANGRIYPENILKREVMKYQKLIDERMALGECYTPDVLVLCESGWKCIAHVTEDDNILTLNTETNKIEIQKVSKKIEFDYNGNLIRLEGRNISETVTPNHGYPVYNSLGKFSGFYTAEQIMAHEVENQNNCYIPKQGVWDNTGDEYFVLKGLKKASKKTLKKHPDCKEDKLIPMDTFMKFMGIYLAEGNFRKIGDDITIFQNKLTTYALIEDLFKELGLKYSIKVTKNNRCTFRVSDPRLKEYLRPLGKNHINYYVPFELKQQSKESLRHLYDWFVLGEGMCKSSMGDILTISKQLTLDLNEIQLKIGQSGKYFTGEALDKDKKNCDIYYSLCSKTKGIALDEESLQTSWSPYNGKVMCLEVPNHTFYVMSNGHCHWSKNCNHPAESTIDLGRISHNIIECHWENQTLVGKIEFNLTEGFRRYGICSSLGDTCANLIINGYKIGVSSRGVGSVENKLGKTVVCDDFELICWDVVATPSTPGSYIGSKETLQQYVEQTEQPINSAINEKINKINKLLF